MPVSVDSQNMDEFEGFDHEHRRRIYDCVERRGAVRAETVRRKVTVEAPSSSKPARSGPDLNPTMPMPREEFEHHVSMLKRDGYLEGHGETLRVAMPIDADATTVDLPEREVDATVRPARQEDITGIVAVVESIAEEGDYAVAQRLVDEVTRDDVLLRHNESENRVFFVATVDDDAVGWLHVEAVQSPMMDHTAELTVGVIEAYRGNGIASTLMERGLEWAEEHGLRKVYQNLPATNETAVEFLESEGWVVESTREDHYRTDDGFVDEVGLATWLGDGEARVED